MRHFRALLVVVAMAAFGTPARAQLPLVPSIEIPSSRVGPLHEAAAIQPQGSLDDGGRRHEGPSARAASATGASGSLAVAAKSTAVTPASELQRYAMILASLGVMGFIALRSRN